LLATSYAATDGRCNMACVNDSAQICGGPGGLSLYQLSSTLPNATSSILSSSMVSSTTRSEAPTSTPESSSSIPTTLLTTSTSSSRSVSPSASLAPWSYLGCANDTSTRRALTGSSVTSGTLMTVEYCQAFCENENYPLAGLE